MKKSTKLILLVFGINLLENLILLIWFGVSFVKQTWIVLLIITALFTLVIKQMDLDKK